MVFPGSPSLSALLPSLSGSFPDKSAPSVGKLTNRHTASRLAASLPASAALRQSCGPKRVSGLNQWTKRHRLVKQVLRGKRTADGGAEAGGVRGAGPRGRAVGSFLSVAHGPYPRETTGTVILASLKVATPFPEAPSLGCIRVWGSRGTVYIGGEAMYPVTETNLQTHVGSSSEAAKLCHIHNVLCDCWLPV